jgi:alkanesulfonate monooxygenase SsuD/methylene tetrahydromethanopterin reductase-like flavin-dependent oxidoreductase (luciferase family)
VARGLPFPPTAERFERLEEELQIFLQMCSEDQAPYRGKHYTLERTPNSPQPLRRLHPPIRSAVRGRRRRCARNDVVFPAAPSGAPFRSRLVQRYGSSDGQERGAGGRHEGRETCLRFLPFTFRSVAQNAGLLRIPTTPTRREEY